MRIETVTCFHHTSRETGRSCTRCGRPACSECLTDAPVGAHCFECMRAARPSRSVRVRQWNASNNLLVTKAIIAVNAAVFVATAPGGNLMGGAASELQLRLALFGPAVASGDWYRVITSSFVHDGLLHIAFNMLILYRLGEMLEPALGRIRFVAVYFAALICGSLGALIVTPNAVTVGASGAVFGLMGAAAVGLRQRGINIMQTGIGMLLVINLVLSFRGGISLGGHIGGLVGGAAVGSVMLRTPTNRRTVIEGLSTAGVVVVAAVIGIGFAVHR